MITMCVQVFVCVCALFQFTCSVMWEAPRVIFRFAPPSLFRSPLFPSFAGRNNLIYRLNTQQLATQAAVARPHLCCFSSPMLLLLF